ncbi:hypothetical protein [Streptomyces sp. LS1784]|uniref:hypothetical protein n=1 Tax=Streptomyces sp. LS1784 TaxID=2851533 RepID=UPI001CCA6E55|nr:hypothetical protein [Streptomyces sp. LS1784]
MLGGPADGPAVRGPVRNKNRLYKPVKSNGKWIPDPSWSAIGKQIRFAGGSGAPDSEGLTVGGNGPRLRDLRARQHRPPADGQELRRARPPKPR